MISRTEGTYYSAAALLRTNVALAADDQLPDSIQWMPPGWQEVEPSVNGKPMKLRFEVTPQVAIEFNNQLQEMRAAAKAGTGDEPYIDFNHEDRERAAEGLEFYWGGDDPKTGGVRLRLTWSAAGKAAVLGRNYRRFSPQWDFDPITHRPIFISENLGGLVNRAAFRKIAQVIAKDGSASTSTTHTTMTDAEFKSIVADALKPIGDRLTTLETRIPAPATTAAAKGADNNQDLATLVGKAVGDAIKPFAEKLDNAEKSAQKAMARAAIEPHIKRGAIPPQDADTIAGWETAWIANAKFAEAQMAKLPAGKASARVTPATGQQDGAGAELDPQQAIIAKAHDLVAKSGGRMNLVDALGAAARSAEGEEQYREFRQTFASGKPATNKN